MSRGVHLFLLPQPVVASVGAVSNFFYSEIYGMKVTYCKKDHPKSMELTEPS